MGIDSMKNSESKLKIEAIKIETAGETVKLVPNKIFGDTSVLEMQYNPDNLSLKYGQKIASQENVGKSDNNQTIIGKDDDSITFNLVFDTSMNRDSNGAYASVKDIYIKNLKLLIKDKDGEEDKFCKISWGNIISFIGILKSLIVNYTMFSQDGTPLRAKVELIFSQKSVDLSSSSSFDKKNLQDNKKRVRLNPNEYLGLLAALEYGSADKWKSIASANSIDNPRLIVPGDEIVIP